MMPTPDKMGESVMKKEILEHKDKLKSARKGSAKAEIPLKLDHSSSSF